MWEYRKNGILFADNLSIGDVKRILKNYDCDIHDDSTYAIVLTMAGDRIEFKKVG